MTRLGLKRLMTRARIRREMDSGDFPAASMLMTALSQVKCIGLRADKALLRVLAAEAN